MATLNMIFPELLLPVNTLSSDVTGRDGKLMTCISLAFTKSSLSEGSSYFEQKVWDSYEAL